MSVLRRALSLYQYLAPALLTPLSFILWFRSSGDVRYALFACFVPILYAYIVPGIGTNVLRLWEFDTKLRLGNFRPHHGFVFGSATATLAWCCLSGELQNIGVMRAAFVLASVLGFWNVLYDIAAVRAGMIRVYNQPWADGQGPEAIVMDYAPLIFAGFGAVYGAGLGVASALLRENRLNTGAFPLLFVVTLAAAIILPVISYIAQSYRKHGHSGLWRCVKHQ